MFGDDHDPYKTGIIETLIGVELRAEVNMEIGAILIYEAKERYSDEEEQLYRFTYEQGLEIIVGTGNLTRTVASRYLAEIRHLMVSAITLLDEKGRHDVADART